MSLREQIELNKNDISGSRTKNRLTVQISYRFARYENTKGYFFGFASY